jgi:hypothetical protein
MARITEVSPIPSNNLSPRLNLALNGKNRINPGIAEMIKKSDIILNMLKKVSLKNTILNTILNTMYMADR